MIGDCGFMAATLYAKSIFGEDALANLSIEKPLENPLAPVTGHIRIRAKSQVGTYSTSSTFCHAHALFCSSSLVVLGLFCREWL